MLLPGHEGELCNYLKEMGLIQRSVRCSGSEKIPNCSSPMKWTQARIIDKYTWKCNDCNTRCSIREDSFFKLSKCSLMQTIRILLGWCKDMDAEGVSAALSKGFDKVFLKKIIYNFFKIIFLVYYFNKL